MTLDTFAQAYITAALWSSTDDAGDPLDRNYDADDLDHATRGQMIDDCAQFQDLHSDLLEGSDPSQAGHDFWLTRNRHGAGFWDRDPACYPADPTGRRLTSAAHAFGGVDLYIGDDGRIYC